MRVETLDLSEYSDKLSAEYRSMEKTYIRLLSSHVPESFLKKFENEEVALKELLDVIYGTMDFDDDQF